MHCKFGGRLFHKVEAVFTNELAPVVLHPGFYMRDNYSILTICSHEYNMCGACQVISLQHNTQLMVDNLRLLEVACCFVGESII